MNARSDAQEPKQQSHREIQSSVRETGVWYVRRPWRFAPPLISFSHGRRPLLYGTRTKHSTQKRGKLIVRDDNGGFSTETHWYSVSILFSGPFLYASAAAACSCVPRLMARLAQNDLIFLAHASIRDRHISLPRETLTYRTAGPGYSDLAGTSDTL